MNLTGAIVEIGDLDGEGGTRGIVVARSNGTFVTVKGLTQAEVRGLMPHLFKEVEVSVAGAPP